MPLLSHPTAFRTTQLLLTLTYLTLIIYSSTHIGYWRSTSTTLTIVLGISASLLTTLHLTHALYRLLTLHRAPSAVIYDTAALTTPFTATPAAVTTTTTTNPPLTIIANLAFELALLFLWAAVVAIMLRPKGKDFRVLFDEPPRVAWGFAVAGAGVEVVGFGVAAVAGVRDR